MSLLQRYLSLKAYLFVSGKKQHQLSRTLFLLKDDLLLMYLSPFMYYAKFPLFSMFVFFKVVLENRFPCSHAPQASCFSIMVWSLNWQNSTTWVWRAQACMLPNCTLYHQICWTLQHKHAAYHLLRRNVSLIDWTSNQIWRIFFFFTNLRN
jgi:hypothetical protein